MELKELEIRAARLEELPGRDKLDWYEQQLFLSLRHIYHAHKIGAMDKAAASREKHLILSSYHKEREIASLTAALATEHEEGIRKSQSLRIAINKAETLEEKFRLAIACIIALTGDETISGNLGVLEENAECGNAVTPPVATALVRANLPECCPDKEVMRNEFRFSL